MMLEKRFICASIKPQLILYCLVINNDRIYQQILIRTVVGGWRRRRFVQAVYRALMLNCKKKLKSENVFYKWQE